MKYDRDKLAEAVSIVERVDAELAFYEQNELPPEIALELAGRLGYARWKIERVVRALHAHAERVG
jgi:hypothetical protein